MMRLASGVVGVMGLLAVVGCAEKPGDTAPAATPPTPAAPQAPSAAPASAVPTADAPKVDAPKTETPKVDEPKTDASAEAKTDDAAEPPPPARPEELAKLPKADPGWPKPDQKPVATALTPEGVRVEDYVVGTGMPVLPGAVVTMHFVGAVKDGIRFQSTYATDEPQTQALKNLLPGMRSAMVGMRVGGKRRMHVPAAHAFAEKGIDNDKGEIIIPANSDLIFDVELLDVKVTITDPSKEPPKPETPGAIGNPPKP